jgi:single-stranded-DNA-specific exonuclease
VIGIVASKVQEKYFRPTIIIATEGKIGKGSCRSIPGFHLYNALVQHKSYLITFGGHKLAAGFTIYTSNIKQFKEKMEAYAETHLPAEELESKFKIDGEIELKEINEKLKEEIQKFAPFGLGNPKPTFLTRKVQVVGEPEILKKEHIKFRIRIEGNRVIKAIGFGINMALSRGQFIDLIYEIDEEKYLGEKKIFLRVKDIDIL